MAMTLESLLAPVSQDSPAGEDLSYDNDRAKLEQAFESSESDNPKDASEEQDWRGVLKLIESQFARTKDVWLAVYLCRAGAKSGSLETVELGSQTLAGLFERYWEPLHPQLEELGLPGRKAPCDSLSTRGGFLGPLERMVLIAHPRLGVYTGVDLERFRTGGDAAEGYGMFRKALEELGDAGLAAALARLEAIEDGLRRADRVFTTEAAGEPSPNFAAAYATLAGLLLGVRHFLPEPVVPMDEEPMSEDAGEPGGPAGNGADSGAGASGGGARGGGRSFGGAVDSRQDVLRALTAVVDYYRRREPSHPVQLLVQRAQGWVELDFLTLLREIAPAAVDQAGELLNSKLTPGGG